MPECSPRLIYTIFSSRETERNRTAQWWESFPRGHRVSSSAVLILKNSIWLLTCRIVEYRRAVLVLEYLNYMSQRQLNIFAALYYAETCWTGLSSEECPLSSRRSVSSGKTVTQQRLLITRAWDGPWRVRLGRGGGGGGLLRDLTNG